MSRTGLKHGKYLPKDYNHQTADLPPTLALFDRGQRFYSFFYRFPWGSPKKTCSKPMCVAQGSPKTYFGFPPYSIYHMFSKLFDPVDFTSYIVRVKVCVTINLCFMLNIGKNLYKICTVLLLVKRNCCCYSDRHLGQSLTWNIRSCQSPGHGSKICTKGMCFSHSQPLLGKVKTDGQGCDFH